MNFPHLLWAITNWGPHYKLARAVGCSESCLSRCLYGRSTFTDEERASIAGALGQSEQWLFEQVEPPAPTIPVGLIHADSYRNLKTPGECNQHSHENFSKGRSDWTTAA